MYFYRLCVLRKSEYIIKKKKTDKLLRDVKSANGLNFSRSSSMVIQSCSVFKNNVKLKYLVVYVFFLSVRRTKIRLSNVQFLKDIQFLRD